MAIVGQLPVSSGSADDQSGHESAQSLTPGLTFVDMTALAGAAKGGIAGEDDVVGGGVPLVVCVSADLGMRERVVRQLEDCGIVLICTDLAELRAMLFPADDPAVGAPRAAAATTSIGAPAGVVKLGELVIDVSGHLVTWRGQPLPLTRLERELIGRLASPPVAVWTYQRLFDAVWSKAYLGDTSILHSAVKRLRGKLRAVGGGLGVETVRGVGYRLALPV
jgi:hypothetical protein